MNIFYKVLSRGISEDAFNALSVNKQKKYIKEHPTCKYAKDVKILKRLGLYKTKSKSKTDKDKVNTKKAKVASTPVKNTSVKELIKQKEKALKIAKQRDGSFFSGPGTKRIHTKRTQKQLQKEIDELKKSLLKPKKSDGAKKAEKVFKDLRSAKKIANALTKGTYKIKFKKADGTTRTLIGSMEDKYLKKMQFSNSGKTKKKNPNIVVVIDTELDPPAFRSFNIERLISMKKV